MSFWFRLAVLGLGALFFYVYSMGVKATFVSPEIASMTDVTFSIVAFTLGVLALVYFLYWLTTTKDFDDPEDES